MDEGLSLILAGGLIARVRVPRCIYPRLLLRGCYDTLQFGDARFKKLLESISFLSWEHIVNLIRRHGSLHPLKSHKNSEQCAERNREHRSPRTTLCAHC